MKRTCVVFVITLLVALSLGIGVYFFTAFRPSNLEEQEKPEIVIPQTDVDEEVDVIRALLLFHAADYFVYRGAPIGFQYDMLNELKRGLGKSIEIIIETDVNKIKKELFENNYDIIIMDFHTGFLHPFLERSIPHSYSYPVLVSGTSSDSVHVESIWVSGDFSAKLFFDKNSPYYNYNIQKTHDYSTEELFEKVDNGEIVYLICDYNQAVTLIPFYSNVQILDKAGPQFERRWILNKKNVQLNEDINHWLLDLKKTPKYRWLLQKYFTPESSFIHSLFTKKQTADISQYDAIIKKYAKKYDFDWRFIASIIFQETKFTPGLTGKGGSHGLMQLMPAVMEFHGISTIDDDETNIRAGIQHLHYIQKYFDDIEDEEERLYFVAASYNAGRGHIFDAQRLCMKYGKDHKKWENVSKYLKLKSQREYAADPVVKSGYFPGAHTVKYADRVMNRYAVYKVAYP